MLRRLIAALDGGVQATYDAVGIDFKPRYYPTIWHLQEIGEVCVGDLAALLGVSQPAVTQTLGEMQAVGLVELVSGSDKRRRLARLTAEAHVLVARMQPIWRAVDMAAAELDAALPAPLGAVLKAALDALNSRDFESRIIDAIESGPTPPSGES